MLSTSGAVGPLRPQAPLWPLQATPRSTLDTPPPRAARGWGAQAAPTTLKAAFLEPMTGELATQVALEVFAKTDAEVGRRGGRRGSEIATPHALPPAFPDSRGVTERARAPDDRGSPAQRLPALRPPPARAHAHALAASSTWRCSRVRNGLGVWGAGGDTLPAHVPWLQGPTPQPCLRSLSLSHGTLIWTHPPSPLAHHEPGSGGRARVAAGQARCPAPPRRGAAQVQVRVPGAGQVSVMCSCVSTQITQLSRGWDRRMWFFGVFN